MWRLEPETGRVSRTSRPSPPAGEVAPLGAPLPGAPPPVSPLLTSRRHIDLLRVCSALGAPG
ncbi:putative leader peptide [Streptomyces sp. NPDC056160]|uniref:putative leader peptide n=1 Tax=Streptomyces sp. NPDC056160 TaxID=3345731 RepID=UPI0035D7DF11